MKYIDEAKAAKNENQKSEYHGPWINWSPPIYCYPELSNQCMEMAREYDSKISCKILMDDPISIGLLLEIPAIICNVLFENDLKDDESQRLYILIYIKFEFNLDFTI